MSSTVHEYKKYLNLLRVHHKLFVIISLAIMTTVTLTSYLLPRKYAANSVVFIEKNIINELVKGITATTSLDDSVKVLTYALNSRTLMMKVVNDLDINLRTKSDADIEKMIIEYQKNTAIKVKDKDLFTITFTHADPKFARDYVNTLIRCYIAQNVSSKRDQSVDASQFLSGQIDNFRLKLDKAESAVIEYKGRQGVLFNLDESTLLQEISSAQQKLYDLQLRRKLLEGQLKYARSSSDPLVTRLSALQKRLEELRVDFTENFPEVQAVKAQIEALKEETGGRRQAKVATVSDPQEVARLTTELQALKEGEQQLSSFIAYNQQLLQSVPTSKATLEKLEAEKENQKKMYDTLFSRHDQSEMTKDMQLQDRTSTFRIVDPALTPIRPSSPNRIKIMLMGIIAGLGGGAALLLILDALDQTVKSTEDLNSFGLPVLAVIPVYLTPVQVQQNLAALRRFSLLSGLYFIFLLSFLLMESLKLTVMDTLLNSIGLPALVQRLFL